MSSRQRKRPGGAVGSRPARKRSRLLPSSAGGTSQTEPVDLEQSGTPAFEAAGEDVIDLTGEDDIDLKSEDVIDLTGEDDIDLTSEDDIDLTGEEFIDLTGESSECEVITVSDDESPVDREQSQQQPHLFRASENSAEPLARDDEEEPREDDGDWLLYDFDLPYWSDEDSHEDREQNQQHSHLSRSAENSAGPLTTHDEEEPRHNNGARPAGPASPPVREHEDSEVHGNEQSQQYPLGSGETENSAELGASDNEEEPRDNDEYVTDEDLSKVSINSSEWPDRFESPPTWQDDITDDWEESQQYLPTNTTTGSRSGENSLELLASNLQQEPRDIEFEPPGLVSPSGWEDDNAEFPEVSKQRRRNATLKRHEQVDGSGNGTGANDAPVADSAPAEQGAEDEDTDSSDAQPGVIRCPICMDFYSEIVRSGRLIVATMCGHVFCSECLPVALESAGMCPTCRMELTPDLYIPIYI